jgi:tetratricopeptide (TPR) repeat protein
MFSLRASTLASTAALLAVVGAACAKPVPMPREMAIPPLGSPSASGTSREDLARTVAAMDARLAARPEDATAAVTLADALLRQARVTGNAGLASRAEIALQKVLARDPQHYHARRMLAAVHLAQHRFRDAIRAAERCLQVRSDDAWPYGVAGDAHLELGDYDAAFDAFDRMLELRPDAAAYARASYARELQGDLPGAIKLMTMALEATSPQDPESLAWHHAQLGGLYLAAGRLSDARREYEHADYVFPGHPLSLDGRAQVAAAAGRIEEALALVQSRLASAPTPAALALSGDLLATLGRPADADRQYRLADAAWRSDAPEPARLAVFLADRGWQVDEAVRIAESAAAERHDIFTDDALAWAYFQAGRLDEARAASARALRTGSRDRTLREHARVIAAAGTAATGGSR